MSKKCKTPGKRAFETRKEAYDYSKQQARKSFSKPYECSCGKYHLTTHGR